jgi:hypothetical protein
MEMGLTLLAQFGLSQKYWVDSFFTAIFLINRLPSPTLKNESPFSKIFKKSPDYTNLKTFGCLCYPLLRPYTNHKLSFRSKSCIFIGYGGNQRGYKCLDPKTHKVGQLGRVLLHHHHPRVSPKHKMTPTLDPEYSEMLNTPAPLVTLMFTPA